MTRFINNDITNQIKRYIYRPIDSIEERKAKEEIINSVINNLLDLNQETVVPFNKVQTSKIRTIYGIKNNTIYPSNQPNNLEKLLVHYIYTEYNYQKQQTIFNNLDDSKLYLKEKSIFSLEMDNKTTEKLIKNRIFTIGHLINRSKVELLQLKDINKSSLEEIINQVHKLGLKFIDDLEIETQKDILSNNIIYTEIEKFLPQPISNHLKENNIYTANDLTHLSETELSKFRNLGLKKIEIIKTNLNKLGLSLREEKINQKLNKNQDILSERLIYILPENVSNPLIRANINTLKDLTDKSESNLLNVYSIGSRKIEIIKKVLASLGLSLKDDKQVYEDKEKLLDFPIYMLFPSWIVNCLKNYQVKTLRQLLDLSITDLLKLRAIGPLKANGILNRVHELGFKLQDEEQVEIAIEKIRIENLEKEKNDLEKSLKRIEEKINEKKKQAKIKRLNK
ncbi:MAG: hypothetical protein IKF19_06850 [Bacilli bacterium]|nr:hypothetical protein [Bacilli bacterium]